MHAMLDGTGPPSIAESSLETHLSSNGVSPGLISSLVVNGWTMDSFAACTDSAAGLMNYGVNCFQTNPNWL